MHPPFPCSRFALPPVSPAPIARLDQKEAKAGTFYKAALRIPHGCEGKATTKVTVDLPERLHHGTTASQGWLENQRPRRATMPMATSYTARK
ncbi:DUF1775 domain-containing protein [Brucella abortus]|nr:DUF1775 domain-containing protein [Brucella abortus]